MVEKEILKARELYEGYVEAMVKEKGLLDLLARYRNAILNTRALMSQQGIMAACSACASQEAGGCCFQGVEEWYDHLLLLINLLLDIEIPTSLEIPGCCFFVGGEGCKLLARHAYCVNYLCSKLKVMLGVPQTEKFLTVAGNELFCGWKLESKILRWIREKSEEGRGAIVR